MLSPRAITAAALPLFRRFPVRTAAVALGALFVLPITRHFPGIPTYLSTPVLPTTRLFSSTRAGSGSASMPGLQEHLHPGVPNEVVELWFRDVTSDDQLIAPSRELVKGWFMSNPEFDNTCVAKFGRYLDAIRSSGATAEDILSAVKPANALDWLGIILLLDQIPRNSFRGEDARIAFTVFDPLAQEIAKRAIAQGIVDDSAVLYRPAYRMWFYLPFEHSEHLQMHEDCLKAYQGMLDEVQAVVDTDEAALAEDAANFRKAVTRNLDATKGFLETVVDFEKRHHVIIRRFGRYPHRNKALGRQATAEEEAYLQNGGETFGS